MDLWCFDVFSLNRAADDHALRTIVFELLTRHNLISRFKVGQPPPFASGQGSPLPPPCSFRQILRARSHCRGSHPVPTAVWPFLLLLQSQPLASCIAFQGKVLACGYPAKGSAFSSSALSPNSSSPAWLQFSPLFQPSFPWTLEAWGPEAVSWCPAGLMSLHFFFFGGGLGGALLPSPSGSVQGILWKGSALGKAR